MDHNYIVYLRRLVVRAIEDAIVLLGMCVGIRVLAEGCIWALGKLGAL